MKSEGGTDGGKIHTITKMALIQRCEDASTNDQMWLVSDWRWISSIFEVGLTDIHMDIRTDRPSYRDARTHLKMIRGGW